MRARKPLNTKIPSKREADTEGRNLRDEDYIRKGLSYSAETIKLSETRILMIGNLNVYFLCSHPSVSQRDAEEDWIHCKEEISYIFLVPLSRVR